MNDIFCKLKNPHILLIIFLLLLSIFLIFWIFITPLFSRATAYTRYAQDTTVGYIITQPSKIQKYIRKLAPTATRWIKQVPRFTSLQPGPIRLDWFHNLPREFSLVFNYLPGTGFETYLTILEKRNSTAFIEELHSSHFLKEFCFIEWRSHQCSNIQRDLWVDEGFIYGKMQPDYSIQEITPHSLENKHLIELLWLNKEQNAAIILENLTSCFKSLNNPFLTEWYSALADSSWIYLNLDLIEDNLIEGILVIYPVTPTGIEGIKEGISTLQEWVQYQLPSPIKIEINESVSSVELKWKIQFYDFESQLRRALGNPLD
ncbi:MAG TPA: hypothetical protein PLX23_04050 [Candidatus Hydrogenedens sp.]|nr:hypothetical protein [Candidatus Hydrogenedens sp.]